MRNNNETGQSLVEVALVAAAMCLGMISMLAVLNRFVEKIVTLAIFMISLPAP